MNSLFSRMERFLREEVQALEEKDLKRRRRLTGSAQGPRIKVDGRSVMNLCSNDYLGLAGEARLQEASIRALKKYGSGSGASRLVCGNMAVHQALEEALADFKETESALLFSTGYMANAGIISALFGREDLILCDRLNHASIIDGIILSRAAFRRYNHRDAGHLRDLLGRARGYKKVGIITDSVFSMDGDLAPLKEIVALAEDYGALVMVDEAHAFGVMGEGGRGCVEHFGLKGRVPIQMGTLSKAAGSFGAYCCGSRSLIEFLVNKARSFIYTTGMPPPVAAASLEAVNIIRAEGSRRKRLWENARHVLHGLKRLGFNTLGSETPIIPIVAGTSSRALEFSRRLFEAGLFVQAIRPPAVPRGTARLRLTVTAAHTAEDCEAALKQIARVGKDLCLI